MIASQEAMIEQIAQSIFATMFNLELVRTDDSEPLDDDSLIATVHIAGEWTGCVLITLTPGVALATTAQMLGLAITAVTLDDEREVASELANMVGGNLKSLLPAPSFLSLPTIVSGRDFGVLLHEAHLVDNLMLDCEAGRMQISLYEKSLK
jgi:chemotaxis protein CheX